jgi:aldose 1-epimerase
MYPNVNMSGDSRGLGDARRLSAGDLEAAFLPARGMLGASLKHRGVELLRRVDDLEGAAAKGSTAGIPLLYPWANRLDGDHYAAAGKTVELDPASPLLHRDDKGLPIHGVPWALLSWDVTSSTSRRLSASLDWRREDLLAVFPYPHALEMEACLSPGDLTIAVTLSAGEEGPVPVSFGFHPYFGLAGAPRATWRLELPAMQRLRLDGRGIPDGGADGFAAVGAALGSRAWDDGFALRSEKAAFSISAGDTRISVELLEGFRFAQVYAPPAQDLVALEPMTAPTNALVSGRGLTIVEPGQRHRAVFRIAVSA